MDRARKFWIALSRAGAQIGYAFVAPTGRFAPGASNNVGSGYWGNNLNKGTSASLFFDWERQAFTMDWGWGLNEDQSLLAQVGVVGYEQVSNNGGTVNTR